MVFSLKKKSLFLSRAVEKCICTYQHRIVEYKIETKININIEIEIKHNHHNYRHRQ